MTNADQLNTAATTLAAVVHAIEPHQLDAATPCTEFTVGGLLAHLRQWGPPLTGAGRKQAVPPADAELGDQWRHDLEAYLTELPRAWSAADAWEGTTRVGGPNELPAPLVGGMVTTELVVHGWDLARANGQTPELDEEVIAAVHAEVAATADKGRELGAYGPEVPVAESAPTLDRLLGLTGRDPSWTP